MVKMKVREESDKIWAANKKRITNEQEKMEQLIDTLEKNRSSTSTDDSQKQKVWLELETKKQELEVLIRVPNTGGRSPAALK